jgi:hypothetical protein
VTATLDTRRPADRLNLSDFSAYPVWEFAWDEEGIEGRDESCVRPVDTRVVPRQSYTLVSAEFKDSRGRAFAGFVVVSTLQDEVEMCSGAIIEGSQLFHVPGPEEVSYQRTRAALMVGLGLTEAELSSLTFRLKVPVEGKSWCLDGEFSLRPRPEAREQQLEFW